MTPRAGKCHSRVFTNNYWMCAQTHILLFLCFLARIGNEWGKRWAQGTSWRTLYTYCWVLISILNIDHWDRHLQHNTQEILQVPLNYPNLRTSKPRTTVTTIMIPPSFFASRVTFLLLTISSVSIRIQTQVSAFTVFPENNNGMIRSTPSKIPDVQIELPDFDALFDNIREVSPLASMIITQDQSGEYVGGEQGFEIADEKCKSSTVCIVSDLSVHSGVWVKHINEWIFC